MAPIRIGFMGLSASQGAWANRAHFPYLQNTSKYQVVALSNSSKEAAERAIKHLGLDAEKVKAYGDPKDLAADTDVEWIIVSVNVAIHKPCVWPVIEAKKNVFVEWPLGKNLKEAKEITAFAKEKGIKTSIGLQGRFNQDVLKVKSLVESGRIGKVLSTTVVATAGFYFGGKEIEAIRGFFDRSVGANMLTIGFGHLIDPIQYALGEFTEITAVAANQRPTVDIIDNNGKVIESDVSKDADDHIMVQGKLTSGAVASVSFRGGPSSIDGKAFRWWIYGKDGEIQVEGPSAFLQHSPLMEITIFEAKSGKKEKITVDRDYENIKQKDGSYLQPPAVNVGRFYEAYSNGRTDDYADFDGAVRLHKLMDAITESSNSGKRLVVMDQ